MNKIIIKGFSHGYEEECIPPTLSVEFLGKKHYIFNFRDYYFCDSENTLLGCDGQINPTDAYKDFNFALREILSIYGDSAKSEVIDKESILQTFLNETAEYYYTSL